ncbi:ammonia-forming cytochrome c nitrite reductase subunit c552 [Desulfovibrio subterraneus]|uniref:nitrite reductase (cytochrome; ammonia-forming) n=1 Tax=Desulfovibrio subterraneus TaxID=2718620 RepID=A0A7J0BLG7_9BACT|nr:ammonia-forming cytochrome c nitrite reductase subunit c552 [Desulfovibrio subterraneus]WBF68047.1 ammonia-forming cytochrome c nitrite reductase subunit c552 [Desulfovibrio subterraneus]GFM33924.1 cytochrome c-552 [Desulfovibrio subterraneus]
MLKKFSAVAGVIVVGAAIALTGCSDAVEPVTPTYKTNLDKAEIRNSEFGKVFPLHYQTYLRNDEDKIMTEYGGSVPYNKHDNVNPLPKGYKHAQPYLKNLWLGYAFSFEYRAARGHTYAIEDILNIDRINRYSEKGGLPSTCWNCKTTMMPEFIEKYGDDFWKKDFNEFRQAMDVKDHAIGCTNCHEAETMELQLYSEPLKEFLKVQGREWKDIPRNEKRALMCGQCHVEYYFQKPEFGAAQRPVFPWTEGYDPENIYTYYKGHGDSKIKGFEGQFYDWIHPVSQTPMLKAQHPEYETWINGPHGSAGVSCADCHMTYKRLDGKKKISDHQWTSPLKDPDMAACRQCHTDKTPEYLKGRVVDTQEKVFAQLLIAQEVSVRAHEAIRRASEYTGPKSADYDDLMIEAREWCRKGQFFWDYVSAENSVGFHNPTKALDTLAKSQQFSQKSVDAAVRASNFTIAKDLAGDIKTLVPPIMEHSRELMMDPAHLQTHEWLKYLKPFPKAQQVWDGNKRLIPAPEKS